MAVAALAVAACAWPLLGTASHQKPQAVQITFTGKGGGRYLDHTRWLREDTRECYASLLADEDLRVQWRIAWTGTLAPGAKGYSLAAARARKRLDRRLGRRLRREGQLRRRRRGARLERDDDLQDRARPACERRRRRAARSAAASAIIFRGPVYKSPGAPCQLDIRNDQLVAAVQLDQAALDRIASGKTVTIPVGTRHPAPSGITYKPVRSCSHFPHLYDGTEYLYDCDDTLIWSGSVTIRPS